MKHLCGIFGKWIRVDLQVVDLCVDFLVDYSLILRFKMLPLIICIVLLMCRQVCRENQASSKLQGISTKTVQMSKGKCNLQSTIYITEIVSITLRKLYLYIYISYTYPIRPGIYTTWKIDGQRLFMQWFIIAPYYSPPFFGVARHLPSQQCK